MKRTTGEGMWAMVAAGALAFATMGAVLVTHSPAALADGLGGGSTGIACQTASNVCAITEQPVGAVCSCARVSDGAREPGMVLPDVRG